MGKSNNRLFTSISHNLLVEQLKYKAEEKGILVHVSEESYTSKASFIHQDELICYSKINKDKPRFSGKRDGRVYSFNKNKEIKIKGINKKYKYIHADINGALNIARKVFKSFNIKDINTLNYEVIAQGSINSRNNYKYQHYFKIISKFKHFPPVSKVGAVQALNNSIGVNP